MNGVDAGVESPVEELRGACWGCEACTKFGDEISWSCPERCDASSAGQNVTEATFLADFDYWNSVLELAGLRAGVVSSGCERSARALTTLRAPKKMSGRGRCSSSRGYTARDESRWCDATALTRVEPFYQCIASSHTNYCGTNTASFCLAKSYFDCCPVRAGPLAGAVIGTAVGILAIAYFIIHAVYRKRVSKFRSTVKVVVAANKFKRRLPSIRRMLERRREKRAAAESAAAAERGEAPAPST